MRGGQAKWRGARGLAGALAVHGLGPVVAIPPGRCEAAPRRSAPTCKRSKLIAPPAHMPWYAREWVRGRL